MISNPTRNLAHHADRYPDRVAVQCGTEEETWAGLLGRTKKTAGALVEAGARRGDVVAVLLHNCVDFVALMYATAHVGAIFMPLNWRLAGPELNYIVNHANARLLVSQADLAELVDAAGELSCERILGVGGGWLPLDDAREAADPIEDAADVERDETARLMYTSGTTSRPKGVMLTYGNLEAKNTAHWVELGITGEDRGLACGPLYHVGALDLVTTTMLEAGGSVYALPRFDAGAALDAIERHRITHAWMAPVMINAVLAHPSVAERDLSSLKLLIGGGEKMVLPLVERLLEAFPNAWFADAYGMTETVSGDTFLTRRMTTARLGSVGKPVFNLELRIVDGDDRPVPAGVEGEIVMRGAKVCKGYLHDAEATAHVLRGGWLHTGDIGVIDDDGYLYVVDRLKDMIISGGENIASSEVERVLQEHPGVSETAVVGRPDPRWTEVPVAYVVCPAARPSEDELLELCRAQLSRHKVPKAFRFIEALPRNPSGKVVKRTLREREREASRA